jgi:uncharacterized protein YxjI
VSAQDLVGTERFAVEQKITMMVNRYVVRALGPNDEAGPVLAVAQQKRMAFKEQVTFYTDESRSTPVFGFKARQRMDLNATFDVTDAAGMPIGSFRKDFGKSLLRSTWHLDARGVSAVGQERNANIALLRRVWEVIPIVGEIPVPFVFHFDFTDENGHVVMTSERRMSMRDRYTITVPGARLDGRVAAAMAVALDALQGR